MKAEFFALAFVAALNPKLLAIDLLLIENRRPRAMFLCLLLGGLTVALTIGWLDVLVFHADAIQAQRRREDRRPRAMFLCLLLGGLTVALTIGWLDVLVFHADAIKAQSRVGAGVDL